MNHSLAIDWKHLKSPDHFDEVLEKSKSKPAMVFKHRATSPESISIKKRLEDDWALPQDLLDTYLIEESSQPAICKMVTESAGVDDEYPQILLFADGVTMYDESHEMINVKKIKIALKIINRTFKWMKSRA